MHKFLYSRSKPVRQKNNQIDAIETIQKISVGELVKQHREVFKNVQLLWTIPRIGKGSATAILAQIPDTKAFRDARQLTACAGVILRNITSGSSVCGKPRVSKAGSQALNKVLSVIIIAVFNHNPIIMNFCKG